jgi:hypothetical protein
MILSDMQSLIHHSSKKDVELGAIPALINNAMKIIQQQRSWTFMKDTVSVTIAAGASSVALPSNFKEPQRGKNPLKGVDTYVTNAGFVPWLILSKQEAERLLQIGQAVSDRIAFIDRTVSGSTLNISGQAAQSLQFKLDAYVFLAPVTDPSAENILMAEYPEMVMNKTKQLVYELASDSGEDLAKATYSESQYTKDFTRASNDDAAREVAGRNFRMGGS